MRQLSGLDASMLYTELAHSPMHAGSLSIYDPASAPDGYVDFKSIREQIQARGAGVQPLMEVLTDVPLHLDHPYWRCGGEFDAEYHVRELSLADPGTWEQLCSLVSWVHERPLDRSKPLWEMYLIDGLDALDGYPEGCFALLTKIHHAAIDGAAGALMQAVLHDDSPEPSAGIQELTSDVTGAEHPSSAKLLWQAQLNNLRRPVAFMRTSARVTPRLMKAARGLYGGELQRVKRVPKTRFNGKVSPHRVFNSVQFELKTLRQLKDAATDATINDVALTICGGALRLYLQDKGELPDTSLVAAVPVNIRAEGEEGAGGNQVTNISVPLHTEIDDPVERLQAIHSGAQHAKELMGVLGGDTIPAYLDFLPSNLVGPVARLSSHFGLTERIRPIYNCSVTNVPGSRVPQYLRGAQMIGNFGLGPVMDGVGIFHIINSYCDSISISFTSCREMVPDPEFYALCIGESYEALSAALSPAPKSRTRKGKAAKRKN